MFRTHTLALIALGAVLGLGQWALAATPAPATPAEGRLARLTQALNLTTDEVTQARTIFANEHQQVLKVLTPQQLDALKAARGKVAADVKALNLTADQKAQIRTIRQNERTQMQAINGNAALSAAEKTAQLATLRQTTRQQIMQVLTPDELTQLQNELQAARKQGFQALELTQDQITQITQFRQQANTAFRAILTPAQQQQFDQMHAAQAKKAS